MDLFTKRRWIISATQALDHVRREEEFVCLENRERVYEICEVYDAAKDKKKKTGTNQKYLPSTNMYLNTNTSSGNNEETDPLESEKKRQKGRNAHENFQLHARWYLDILPPHLRHENCSFNQV